MFHSLKICKKIFSKLFLMKEIVKLENWDVFSFWFSFMENLVSQFSNKRSENSFSFESFSNIYCILKSFLAAKKLTEFRAKKGKTGSRLVTFDWLADRLFISITATFLSVLLPFRVWWSFEDRAWEQSEMRVTVNTLHFFFSLMPIGIFLRTYVVIPGRIWAMKEFFTSFAR